MEMYTLFYRLCKKPRKKCEILYNTLYYIIHHYRVWQNLTVKLTVSRFICTTYGQHVFVNHDLPVSCMGIHTTIVICNPSPSQILL